MKTPNKVLKRNKLKELVKPRSNSAQELLEFTSLCDRNGEGGGGACYRRNRSIENEDDILF